MSIVLNSYQPLELILRKQLVDDKSDNKEPSAADTFSQRKQENYDEVILVSDSVTINDPYHITYIC